jgi:hypothetical protein
MVAIRSLKCIQNVSQTLSDAVQLGWRASAPSKGYTKQTLRAAVAEAAVNIQTLRGSPFSRPIDVERTVIHMAGKLSSVELVRVIAARPVDVTDFCVDRRFRASSYCYSSTTRGSIYPLGKRWQWHQQPYSSRRNLVVLTHAKGAVRTGRDHCCCHRNISSSMRPGSASKV